MAEGTQKAQVHPKFKLRLEDLQKEHSKKIQDDFIGGEQRPWQIPKENKPNDLFLIATLHEPALMRDEINTNYEECMESGTGPGTVGDIIALKLQVDYMACEERAYRFRHSSIIRCSHFAHGRRRGHYKGALFPFIERQVADAIAAGAPGEGPKAPTGGSSATKPTAEVQ